jgi:hypothetical protein
MEPVGSLQRSQQPITVTYHEPTESCPNHHTHFLESPICAYISQVVSSFNVLWSTLCISHLTVRATFPLVLLYFTLVQFSGHQQIILIINICIRGNYVPLDMMAVRWWYIHPLHVTFPTNIPNRLTLSMSTHFLNWTMCCVEFTLHFYTYHRESTVYMCLIYALLPSIVK